MRTNIKKTLDSLFAIRRELVFLVNSSEDIDFSTFQENEVMKRSFCRSTEIIGLASKDLEWDYRRDHPEVDWEMLTDVSDLVSNNYANVNYYVIWDMAKNRSRRLLKQVDQLIEGIYSS